MHLIICIDFWGPISETSEEDLRNFVGLTNVLGKTQQSIVFEKSYECCEKHRKNYKKCRHMNS